MPLGMGWSKSRGIGRTNAQNTEIREAKPRPLGLGANLDEKSNCGLFALGDRVKVFTGPHKGYKGVVTDLDVTNVRLTIQTKNGKSINVSELSVARLEEKIEKAPANIKTKRYEKDKVALPKQKTKEEF